MKNGKPENNNQLPVLRYATVGNEIPAYPADASIHEKSAWYWQRFNDLYQTALKTDRRSLALSALREMAVLDTKVLSQPAPPKPVEAASQVPVIVKPAIEDMRKRDEERRARLARAFELSRIRKRDYEPTDPEDDGTEN